MMDEGYKLKGIVVKIQHIKGKNPKYEQVFIYIPKKIRDFLGVLAKNEYGILDLSSDNRLIITLSKKGIENKNNK